MSATSGGKICQLCGEGFQLTVVLNQHMKVAHVENGDYDCGFCSCVFSDEQRLQAHQSEKHGYVAGSEPTAAAAPERETSRWLKCRFCHMEFSNSGMLKSHEKSKHGDELDSSEASEEEDEEDEHEEIQDDEDRNNCASASQEYNRKQVDKLLKMSQATLNTCVAYDTNLTTGKLCSALISHARAVRGEGRSRSNSGSSDLSSHKPLSRMNGQVSSASSSKGSSVAKNSGVRPQEKLSNSNMADTFETSLDSFNGQRYMDRVNVVTGKQNDVEKIAVNEEQNRSSGQSDSENQRRSAVQNGEVEDTYTVGQTHVTGQEAVENELTGCNRRKSDYFDKQPKDRPRNQVSLPELSFETHVPSFMDALPADDDEYFTCNLCGADYATQQTLENHKRSNHVEGGRFPCNHCSCVFATRSELVVHGSTHDDQMMTAEESETADVSQSEEANTSMAVLECELCGQSFLDDLDLALHKIRNHVQDGYPCSSCSCSFITVNDMQVHEEMFHAADASFNNSFAPMITQVTSLPSISSTYCDKCGIDFNSESAAKIHQKNSHVVGGYECQYCPCSYGSLNGLNIHVNRKHKEQVGNNYGQVPQDFHRAVATPTLACELCESVFSSKHDLTKHRKERHFVANIELHTCNQCSKNFSSEETLNSHILAIHLNTSMENFGVRVLQKNSNTSVLCDLCGFGFSSEAGVKAHKSRSHMTFGTRCPLCCCCFQSQSGVKSHMAMFHKGAPVPTHFVTTTSQSTQVPQSGKVRQPLERQKPPLIVIEDGTDDADADTTIFKCVECDWVLSDATDLQNHRIQFHGFKPLVASIVESSKKGIDAETADENVLKCLVCDLEFSRASEAESHRKRNHVSGGQFPCKLCKCVFDNGGSLHAHEVTKHKSEVASPTAESKTGAPVTCVCSLCGKIFPKRAELNYHKSKAHKRTGLPCQHCTCVFGTRVEYDAHQAQAHRNKKVEMKKRRGAPNKKDISRYVCQYPNCDFRAKIQNGLSTHIQNVHSQGRRVSEDAYECTTCSKAFRTKQALVAHRSSQHENENNIVQIAVKHPVTTSGGKFVCHFCSIQFARNKAFVNHVSMCHENDQMTCKDCDPHKAFQNLRDFNRHRGHIHGDHVTSAPGQELEETSDYINPVISSCVSLQQAYVKPVQPRCELCNRVFFHRRSLWSHRQRSHVVGGDYGCEKCNCGFQKQRSLATHTLIYHGKYIDSDLKKREEIPGECDLCGETFTYAARLEIHSRKAHKPDGEYQCPDCCCRFERRTEMNLHRVKRHGLLLPERKEEKAPLKVLQPPRKSARRLMLTMDTALPRPSSPLSFGGDDMEVSMPSPEGSPASPTENFTDLQTVVENVEGTNPKMQTTAIRDHACKECTMKFSELKLLITHQKMRHNYEERRCSICQMSFVSMMVLIDHIEAKHAKEKSTLSLSKPGGKLNLTCPKCGVTFGSKTSLDMHRKKAHVPNGRFPCERCTCVFAAETELVNHMHSHNLRNKTSSVSDHLINTEVLGQTISEEVRAAAKVGISSEDTGSIVAPVDGESKRGRGSARKDYSSFFDNPPPLVNLNPVAKKSTSKPAGSALSSSGDHDILGMAFSAAMNDEIPVTSKITANAPTCSTCGKSSFPSVTALRRHELECKSQQQTKGGFTIKKLTATRCRFCKKVFTLKVSYNDHMKKKHGITVADSAEPNKIAEIDLEDDVQTGTVETPRTAPYRKPMPKSVAERKSKLKNNIGQDGSLSSPLDASSPVVSAPPTPPPPPPPPKTKWKCSKCKTLFKKKWKWTVHCYVSHGRDANGSLKCDKCPATFSLKLGHYVHAKFAHRDKPRKLNKMKRKKNAKRKTPAKIPKLDNLILVPSENPNETIIEFILPEVGGDAKNPVNTSQGTAEIIDDSVVSAGETLSDTPLALAESALAFPPATETHVQAAGGDNKEAAEFASSVMPTDSIGVDKSPQKATDPKNSQHSEPEEPVSTVSSTTEVLAEEATAVTTEKVTVTAIPSGTSNDVQTPQGAIQDSEITSTPSVTEKLAVVIPQPVLVQNKVKKVAKKEQNKETKKKTKKLNRTKKEPQVPEKGFFSTSSLKKREKLINWEEKMHPCKVCAMKFRRTKHLYRHERINHPGTPEFLCIQCPSMTSLSKELDHHEEIYHSDYPNLKEVLEAMTQKRGVKRKVASSDIPAKPKKPKKESYLDIDSLLASFTMPNNIFEERKGRNENEAEAKRRRRIKNFGIHTCRICSMMFRSKQGLSNHLKIHSGEKVFSCRTCKVQFRFYTDYMTHRKKHLALQCLSDPMRNLFERPSYGTCSECQATFKTNSLAELHMEEVHPYMKFKDMCSQLCNIWQGPGDTFDFNLDLLC